jgi:hypothetical protein
MVVPTLRICFSPHGSAHPQVTIQRDAVGDARFVWEARALLGYLLLRLDGWDIRPNLRAISKTH